MAIYSAIYRGLDVAKDGEQYRSTKRLLHLLAKCHSFPRVRSLLLFALSMPLSTTSGLSISHAQLATSYRWGLVQGLILSLEGRDGGQGVGDEPPALHQRLTRSTLMNICFESRAHAHKISTSLILVLSQAIQVLPTHGPLNSECCRWRDTVQCTKYMLLS